MLPYGRQSISEDDIAAVAAVMRGDWLTTGPTVTAFEHALATTAGAAHAVSVTSGTAALHTAYQAAGVGPGTEVITTPMTFIATASCAAILGAKITFADIEAGTANIDPACVAALISPDTRVVAGVDYAGQPVRIDELNELAHAHGALTVQDAAHSIGSVAGGRPIGSIADLTAFSFFPTKNMTTAEGGAVVTDDAALAQRARDFHTIGMVREHQRLRYPDEGPWHQEVHEFGLNYRLSDLHCALGLSQLARLADFKKRRQRIFDRYQAAFDGVDGLQIHSVRADIDPIWHLYPVRIKNGRRREVFDKLHQRGIGVQVNYLPVYWHPAFEDLGYRRGMCPNAEAFYAEEISLPMFAGLTDSQQDQVIDALIDIIRH